MIIVCKNKLGEEVGRFDPRTVPVRKIRRNLAKTCARQTGKPLHRVWPEFTRQDFQTTDEDIYRWHMLHKEYMEQCRNEGKGSFEKLANGGWRNEY